ncbi:hypothetical protein F7734_52175 [Scytonema sp. UIC 10036]|uniref:hypothetical protein n=1 Tax=Scytonema sp. UIC 10036 TaxID=2304196 RepID=UPI0012DA6E6B|nr:hypothetical protein [Scytonema sp. UIC 10036]MUH00381.1 hypothetical protein [Scytonema sp. UIC 10036]
MKRVVIRTETTDTTADGTTTTSKTERLEESTPSGLLEAWGFLILILCTFLIFFVTYRIVSNITQRENYGIQERQNQQDYQSY